MKLRTGWSSDMVIRDQALQTFIDAAQHAFCSHTSDPNSTSSLNQIFAALTNMAPQSVSVGSQLSVCSHLHEVSDPSKFDDPTLCNLMEHFLTLESKLVWRRREGIWTGASRNFAENHANAMMVGPGGLEPREDVWLGVSLIGPNVQYPDHRHTPEETYLVISQGDFRQGRNNWINVSKGETFYNPHNIVHSMRSNAHPLFVFWALREKAG